MFFVVNQPPFLSIKENILAILQGMSCYLIALQWFLLIFWDAEMTLQGPFMTPTHTNAIRVELLHFFFCQASQSKSEDIVS